MMGKANDTIWLMSLELSHVYLLTLPSCFPRTPLLALSFHIPTMSGTLGSTNTSGAEFSVGSRTR